MFAMVTTFHIVMLVYDFSISGFYEFSMIADNSPTPPH